MKFLPLKTKYMIQIRHSWIKVNFQISGRRSVWPCGKPMGHGAILIDSIATASCGHSLRVIFYALSYDDHTPIEYMAQCGERNDRILHVFMWREYSILLFHYLCNDIYRSVEAISSTIHKIFNIFFQAPMSNFSFRIFEADDSPLLGKVRGHLSCGNDCRNFMQQSVFKMFPLQIVGAHVHMTYI